MGPDIFDIFTFTFLLGSVIAHIVMLLSKVAKGVDNIPSFLFSSFSLALIITFMMLLWPEHRAAFSVLSARIQGL